MFKDDSRQCSMFHTSIVYVIIAFNMFEYVRLTFKDDYNRRSSVKINDPTEIF